MIITDEQTEHISLVLARLQQQGLSPELTSRAQECTTKLFALLQEYDAAALVALGIVTAIVDGRLQAGDYTLIKP